jgi:MFS transporter, ACS family, glucarate transporter
MMMPDLHFSQAEMGRLFSAFVLGYAAFQIPAGMLADHRGARRVLAYAMLSWVAITVLIAFAGLNLRISTLGSSITSLLVLRFLLGVSEAPTFPAAAQGLVRWVAPLRQGSAYGIVIAGIAVGSATAPLLLSAIMVHWGWRVAVLSSAVPALAIGFAWWRMTEPSPETRADVSGVPDRPEKRFQWSRSLALLVTSYTLEGYVSYIFVFWLYLYFVQVRHFSLMRAGEVSALPWLLSIISIPAGGILSDRLASGSLGLRWGRRAVPMAGLALAGVFVGLGAYTMNRYAAVAYLTLAAGFVLSIEGPSWATLSEISGSRSGTAGGAMNMGSNVGGFVSPMLTPVLAAYFGWQRALCVAAVVAFVAAALWFGVSPTTSQPP